MTTPAPRPRDYDAIGAIIRLLSERPEWGRYLGEMVGWEEAHKGTQIGFEWQSVHCPTGVLNALVAEGIVDMAYKSRSATFYRLHGLLDTQEALASLAPPDPQALPAVEVQDLFDLVSGHDKTKALLRLCVKADKPIHALLVGPPGTAKSLLLEDIGRLPGAEYYVGSTTSKSGLVGLLLQVRPRFLVLDELDKMDDRDMSPLLTLMETGTVTRLLHGMQDRVEVTTKVFAGANDLRRLSAPILSRFARLEVPAYNREEFLKVSKDVLVIREGQGPEMATLIAEEVGRRSNDIRDAVRVARMANGNPLAIPDIVAALWPPPSAGGQGPVPFRTR